MAVVGIDDTDSRSGGMCTTWIGDEIARRLPRSADPTTYLVRLHPAIPHKTRGNGAVAVAASASAGTMLSVARDVIDEYAVVDDPETNPGAVAVRAGDVTNPSRVQFAREAVRGPVTRAAARAVVPMDLSQGWGNGRGLIGAAAAAGAVGATRRDGRSPVFGDWTFERLAYREPARWGTDRAVTLGDRHEIPPGTWDTVDHVTDDLVCVPNSPCPVLYGIRGDDPAALRSLGSCFEGEFYTRTRVFVTNQGTDAHLRPGRIGGLRDGRGYRVRGRVVEPPTTREGGHVTFGLAADGDRCQCMAFAPTGRFRKPVRRLRRGDALLACGEWDEGTLKLEKFALVGRALTRETVPVCPRCDRSMKSAGRGQGYRCRRCDEHSAEKCRNDARRQLRCGWYEVPPGARRHLAKPLARGDYELPVHGTSGPA